MSRHHRKRRNSGAAQTHFKPTAAPSVVVTATKARPNTTRTEMSDQFNLDRIIQKTMVMLFYFLIVTVPFFFTWVNEELFEFNKMLLTYGLTSVIVGLWVSRMIIAKKVMLERTWFDIPILLFLASQILSTIFSMHPYTSIFGYYTRFHGGLLSTITYTLLFYAFVSNLKRRHLKGFFLSLTVAALVVSLYAIPEHFGVSPSCMLITKEANVACWKQDVQNRVFGTFGQPNWLAAYAITLIPLTISLTLNSFAKKQNSDQKNIWITLKPTLYALTGLALLLTLLYTKSRSGFLGFVMGGGVYALGFTLLMFNVPQSTARKAVVVSAGLIASAIVLTLALVGTPFTPNIAGFIKNSQQQVATPIAAEADPAAAPINRLDVGGTDSGEIRKIVWEGAYKVWQRYPLLGSGVETFAYSYYLDRPADHNLVSEWDFLYNKAHNEFLNFLATTGLVGLTAYLVLLGSFIVLPLVRTPTELDADHPYSKLLSLAISSGLIALSVSNFFGFSTVMVSILLFLLPASAWVMVNKTAAPVSTATSVKTWQHLAIAGVGIVTIFMLSKTYTVWQADFLYATGKQLAQAGQVAQGLSLLEDAATAAPNEALYHDELAQTYARIAVSLASQDNATQAAQFAEASTLASDTVLALNPAHVNFYKTRARTFITLSNMDESYLTKAQEILKQGQKLAPTDAKILYNIGLLQLSQGQTAEGQASIEKAIELRPNYDHARVTLAELYEEQGAYDLAMLQYQAILSITPDNEPVAQRLEMLQASVSAQLNL